MITVKRGIPVSFECFTDAGPINEFVWIYNAKNDVCNALECINGNFELDLTDGGTCILTSVVIVKQ